jgi:pilus assembly protein FimV
MAFPLRVFGPLLFAPALALAADLGRLTVLSGVGQPLRAEIEILSVQPGDGPSLAARIPSPDVFWRANLEPPPLLEHLRARVERRPKGRYVVMLSSTKSIENPFVHILVELDSATGRIAREYPFLLEESRPAPVAPELPVGAAPNPTAASRSDYAAESTYVVRPGDTLATIARATRPPGATVEQAVVALYAANEEAFIDGNMNWLRAGTALALPGEAAAIAITPVEARRLILEHRATASRSPPEAQTSGTAVSSREFRDQLRLARPREPVSAGAVPDSALGDDVVALQRALAEAQERIALLQKDLEEVRRLLASQVNRGEGVEQIVRSAGLRSVAVPGHLAAARPEDDGADQNRIVRDLVREHGTGLLIVFLFAFSLWVLMPVKTARAWLNRRRYRERVAARAAPDVSRVSRHVAATHFARTL